MNKKVLNAMQHQIKHEYMNAFAYLDMANQATKMGYFGYSKWLFFQYREEIAHAEKTIDFLMNRHQEVDVRSLEIDFHFQDYDSILEIAQASYENECLVTKLINSTYTLAISEKAYLVSELYEWFVHEQIEEEKTTRQLVKRFQNSKNWILLDKELGERRH